MKLEIKHLAPYLPYELKGQLIGYPDGTTVTMGTYLSNQQKMWTIDMFLQNEVHPILKPLSQLSNEDLIPIGLFIRDIEKHKATYRDNIFAVEDAKAWIRTGMKPVLSLEQVKGIMEHFYSIHADIFNLIDFTQL